MKPSKIESRMNLEVRKHTRKLYRYLMLGLFLVIAFYVSAWFLARFLFTVALTFFMILFSGLVLYLLWKGWFEKRL